MARNPSSPFIDVSSGPKMATGCLIASSPAPPPCPSSSPPKSIGEEQNLTPWPMTGRRSAQARWIGPREDRQAYDTAAADLKHMSEENGGGEGLKGGAGSGFASPTCHLHDEQ